MTRAILAAFVLSAMLSLGPVGELHAGAPEQCEPPPGTIVYRIEHEGDDVGWLEIAIAAEGDATVITTTIDIAISVVYVIPVLDYRHDSREVWRDGRFERFDGLTIDNGREHAIIVLPEGEGLRLVKAGDPAVVHDAALLSWTVWCEAALSAGRLLNPLKGRTKEFTVRAAGEETAGRRYDVEFATPDGSDSRSGAVWYGNDGIVAVFTFPTKRGTQATLIRVVPEG